MSTNVFGIPVDNGTVQQIQIGITNITAQHRAEVALSYINSEGKANDATRFVDDLKRQYGTGTSTLCTIYNATAMGRVPARRGSLTGPSKEAALYTGQNLAGNNREWLLAWNTRRTSVHGGPCYDWCSKLEHHQ
ncbi:hypothetical protein CASFOL_011122 [Castilleja foliolosa]|uniref:Uncharacterized protein n=1 Tax=Castilleja foliolosa TaxID=1961234 RepID=A0ABD3DV60_9LAMI